VQGDSTNASSVSNTELFPSKVRFAGVKGCFVYNGSTGYLRITRFYLLVERRAVLQFGLACVLRSGVGSYSNVCVVCIKRSSIVNTTDDFQQGVCSIIQNNVLWSHTSFIRLVRFIRLSVLELFYCPVDAPLCTFRNSKTSTQQTIQFFQNFFVSGS